MDLVRKRLGETNNAIVINDLITILACNDNKFYPGTVRCTIDLITGSRTAATGCRDGYADATGKCVTNCGTGMYGKALFSSRGLILSSKCYTCNSNCYECIGGGSN